MNASARMDVRVTVCGCGRESESEYQSVSKYEQALRWDVGFEFEFRFGVWLGR